ncbi:C4-dicarboxylate ABC transporter substrate-binding protein [Deltaproteobacteria bacterium]|nr:C4-dicarboxylate ABC transporter substrate-binding protein [Deltaproteobacteria bacterium]
MKLKQILVLTMAIVTILASAGIASAAKSYVSIATGGTSGTYFPIGGAIAQAVSKAGVIQATAETGNASVANINLIAKGDIEVAMVQNDITFWAFKGEQMFKAPLPNVRTICALYPEHVQLIISKDSGIKTLADLKGKRVGVGAPGSGTEGDAKAILGVAGIQYADMKVDFLDFGATTSRFKDNQIDAGFVVAGYPTASVMDLALTKDISLLNFEDKTLADLSKAHPYLVASTIPGKTYKGVDNAVKTPAVMAILVTHDKMADDVIYNFTKAMFENIADIHAAHAKGKEINLATALDGLTAPLHPGAAKFFKEKGMAMK